MRFMTAVTPTTTATSLPAQQCTKVLLQAPHTNGSIQILIGDSAGQNFTLAAGNFIELEVMNSKEVWYKASVAGACKLAWAVI